MTAQGVNIGGRGGALQIEKGKKKYLREPSFKIKATYFPGVFTFLSKVHLFFTCVYVSCAKMRIVFLFDISSME